MSEPATTTPRDEAFSAREDLHRAYAGILSPRSLVHATDAAASHARGHRRRLGRHDNPIGYLFRIGRASLENEAEPGDDSSWRISEEAGVPEALLQEALLAGLRSLPRTQQEVVWLVRACGWTNVQAGEALALGAAEVADAVSGGGRALRRSLGVSDTELGRRLGALADTRISRLPVLVQSLGEADEAPVASAESEVLHTATNLAQPDPPGRWSKLSDPRVLATAIVAVLVLGGGSILVSALRSPTTATDGPAPMTPSQAMQDRPLVEESAWVRSVSARSLAGTFALAAVGDSSAVRAADPARVALPIVLSGGGETTVTDQLAAMEIVNPAELMIEEGDGWRIRYQTGTGEVDGTAIAWTTGVVEVGADRFVFAHNADLELANGDSAELPVGSRLTAVVEFLRLGEVLPAP